MCVLKNMVYTSAITGNDDKPEIEFMANLWYATLKVDTRM